MPSVTREARTQGSSGENVERPQQREPTQAQRPAIGQHGSRAAAREKNGASGDVTGINTAKRSTASGPPPRGRIVKARTSHKTGNPKTQKRGTQAMEHDHTTKSVHDAAQNVTFHPYVTARTQQRHRTNNLNRTLTHKGPRSQTGRGRSKLTDHDPEADRAAALMPHDDWRARARSHDATRP